MTQFLSPQMVFGSVERAGEPRISMSGSRDLATASGIITAPVLAKLVAGAPDKEFLLAAKLVLQHFVEPASLGGLRVERFGFCEDGMLQGLFVDCRTRGSRGSRWISIEPRDASVIQFLLPDSGLLFSESDPFYRVQVFAKRLGIFLNRKNATASCWLHALAVGLNPYVVAQSAGIFNLRQIAWPPYCPITAKDAAAYWTIPFDLKMIRSLPRHCDQT